MIRVPMERLQILVRPDQAALLRTTARQRGIPVTEVVRDAIDEALRARSPQQRLTAWQRFDALPVVAAAPDPADLEATLDDRAATHAWLAR